MTKIELKFGGYQGSKSIHTKAAKRFRCSFRKNLDNRISFLLYENITAGGHKAIDLIKMVNEGKLDFCYFSTSYLADFVPEVTMLDLPFVINDRLSAYKFLDGPLGQFLKRNASGWNLWLLSGNPFLSSFLKMKCSKKIPISFLWSNYFVI